MPKMQEHAKIKSAIFLQEACDFIIRGHSCPCNSWEKQRKSQTAAAEIRVKNVQTNWWAAPEALQQRGAAARKQACARRKEERREEETLGCLTI